MLNITSQSSISSSDVAPPFTGLDESVVSALDVAAQRTRQQMAAGLADLATLQGDLDEESVAALEADVLASYFERMAALEGDGPDVFGAERWSEFASVAAARTRRNALAAQRRAVDAWRVQSVLAGTVVGVSLSDVVDDVDAETLAVRGDLAACGLL